MNDLDEQRQSCDASQHRISHRGGRSGCCPTAAAPRATARIDPVPSSYRLPPHPLPALFYDITAQGAHRTWKNVKPGGGRGRGGGVIDTEKVYKNGGCSFQNTMQVPPVRALCPRTLNIQSHCQGSASPPPLAACTPHVHHPIPPTSPKIWPESCHQHRNVSRFRHL